MKCRAKRGSGERSFFTAYRRPSTRPVRARPIPVASARRYKCENQFLNIPPGNGADSERIRFRDRVDNRFGFRHSLQSPIVPADGGRLRVIVVDCRRVKGILRAFTRWAREFRGNIVRRNRAQTDTTA